jgi:hypothetical protein
MACLRASQNHGIDCGLSPCYGSFSSDMPILEHITQKHVTNLPYLSRTNTVGFYILNAIGDAHQSRGGDWLSGEACISRRTKSIIVGGIMMAQTN